MLIDIKYFQSLIQYFIRIIIGIYGQFIFQINCKIYHLLYIYGIFLLSSILV